jgi:hypothetical protein
MSNMHGSVCQFPMFDPIDTEFRPTVDGVFLLDTPRKLFEAGRFHNITFVMGTVDNEFGTYLTHLVQ